MSTQQSVITLCQLYDAFKALQSAFETFSDMLYGVKCSGLGCDQEILVDPESRRDVICLSLPLRCPDIGDRPCTTSPCGIVLSEFHRLVSAYVARTPGVVKALEATLLKAGGTQGLKKEIEYLTRLAPKGL